MKDRYGTVIVSLIIPLLVILLWVFVTSKGRLNAIILPSPGQIITAFLDLFKSNGMFFDIGWTILRTILGFFVGVITGTFLGTAMGSWRNVKDMAEFSVDFLRSIPATTIFPLFMAMLGFGHKTMIALVAFPCCWLVTINTMYGVRNSSLVRREMGQVFRLSKIKRFFYITLFDAMPSIAASLRLSVAICLHMAIIGEIFMEIQNGIGYRVSLANRNVEVPDMYAVIIVAGILGYILNQLFLIFERKIVFWGGRA